MVIAANAQNQAPGAGEPPRANPERDADPQGGVQRLYRRLWLCPGLGQWVCQPLLQVRSLLVSEPGEHRQ